MKRTVAYITILALAASLTAFAEEHDEEEKKAKAYAKKSWFKAVDESKIFDRNVRLDAKLLPLEDGDKGTYIVTASPEYHAAVHFANEDMEINFKIWGHIKMLDNDRVFVSYATHVGFDTFEGEGEFSTSGSVILKPGEETHVAFIGEKTLTLKVSFPDEAKASKKK